MKKLKRSNAEKGITLIALIITVVALMILAAVAISSIQNDRIIAHAENATENYEGKADEEQFLLDDFETLLNGGIPTVESLQRRYEFSYYSTLSGAVNEVNNATIGVNSDADKETAVAGVYTDDGKAYVVLLKNATESVASTISKDMTINLAGHTLTFNSIVCFDIKSGNVVIDSRNSTVQITHTDGTNSKPIQLRAGTLMVNGGNYIAKSVGNTKSSCGVLTAGNLTMMNVTISVEDPTGTSNGVYTRDEGVTTLNNCYITGGTSGVQSHGALYVDGGTYEGESKAGLFLAGSGKTQYVKNAKIIKRCVVGGSADAENNVVYMDNCIFEGDISPIMLGTGFGEQNNKVYISNSAINLETLIIIDDDSHKLYIGAGNNFDANNTTLPSAVEETEEVYNQQ